MKKIVQVLPLLLFLSSSIALSQVQKFEALDSGGLEIGYEAYVDFHYSYDFNHSKDNYRPYNSNPVNVNQFALAYILRTSRI